MAGGATGLVPVVDLGGDPHELGRWTNDRWRSTLHRVVVPPADADRDCGRQSMAFFHNANWDAVIECPPTCVETDAVPRHAPITAGRHLMDKFPSTQT